MMSMRHLVGSKVVFSVLECGGGEVIGGDSYPQFSINLEHFEAEFMCS